MLLQNFYKRPKKIFLKTILSKTVCRNNRKQESGESGFIKSEKKEDILRHTTPSKSRSVLAGAVRAFFFAPFKASLTIEAALILPVFLFCMTAALRYCTVMETAVKFGTALSETGKSLAITAYAERYGSGKNGGSAIVGVLSAAYAQSQVKSKTGDTSSVKNMNMLLSSFQKDDVIDLVLTYQVKTPFSVVKLPGTFFIQRARVRAWTGRTMGQEGGDGNGEGQSGEVVYVTETGSVYHKDPDCTHLKLSIHAVDVGDLETLRNSSGSIYHVCERCGAVSGAAVYITNEGNRYHSSLSCSGLKRTVKEVTKDEIGTMRACSKCG